MTVKCPGRNEKLVFKVHHEPWATLVVPGWANSDWVIDATRATRAPVLPMLRVLPVHC